MSNAPAEKCTRPPAEHAIHRILWWASILLFTASLTQDGFYIDRPDKPDAWASCFALLVIGWVAVFEGVLAWLANPLLIATWILMRSRSRLLGALVCATASLTLSMSFLTQHRLSTDAAGNTSAITGYGLGYWLWNISIATALFGCIVRIYLCHQSTEQE